MSAHRLPVRVGAYLLRARVGGDVASPTAAWRCLCKYQPRRPVRMLCVRVNEAPPRDRRRFCHVAIAATPPRLSLQASGSSNGWAPPRGSIRRTAVVLADDRFDRGDGPEPACAWATKESLIAPHGTRRGGCLPTIGVTTAIHHPRRRLQARAGHVASTARGSVWSWLVSRSVTVRPGGRSAGAGHAPSRTLLVW